jgi:hypothetical protein
MDVHPNDVCDRQRGQFFEVPSALKYRKDRSFAEVFPGMTILGLPPNYRIIVQTIQLNCKDRNVQVPKMEYFVSEGNRKYLTAPVAIQPLQAKGSSPFALLLGIVCGTPVPKVGGTYEGTNKVTYQTGGQGEHKISIVVEQIENDLNVSFQTASGGRGKGAGKLTGSNVDSIPFQSTATRMSGFVCSLVSLRTSAAFDTSVSLRRTRPIQPNLEKPEVKFAFVPPWYRTGARLIFFCSALGHAQKRILCHILSAYGTFGSNFGV